MEYNLFDLASRLSAQGETIADVKPMQTSKGVIRAAFDYGLAANFTGFTMTKLKQFIGDSPVLSTDELKELGLKGDRPLTRAQANFRLKAQYYEQEFNKAIAASPSGIAGNISKSIAGSLASSFFDPVFILATYGVSVGASTLLKTARLFPVIQQSRRATQLGVKVGLYGGADTALNITGNKLITKELELPYTKLDTFVDAAVGLIFGTIASPSFKVSKAQAKIVQEVTDMAESAKVAKNTLTDIEYKDLTTELNKNLPKVITKDIPTDELSFISLSKATSESANYLTISKRLQRFDFTKANKPLDLIDTLKKNLDVQKSIDPKFDEAFTPELIRLDFKSDRATAEALINYFGLPRESLTDLTNPITKSIVDVFKNFTPTQAKILHWYVRAEDGKRIFNLQTQHFLHDTKVGGIFADTVLELADKKVYSTEEYIKVFHNKLKNSNSKPEKIFDQDESLRFTQFLNDLKEAS